MRLSELSWEVMPTHNGWWERAVVFYRHSYRFLIVFRLTSKGREEGCRTGPYQWAIRSHMDGDNLLSNDDPSSALEMQCVLISFLNGEFDGER